MVVTAFVLKGVGWLPWLAMAAETSNHLASVVQVQGLSMGFDFVKLGYVSERTSLEEA